MARTKQTARKNTGGKAPRKQIVLKGRGRSTTAISMSFAAFREKRRERLGLRKAAELKREAVDIEQRAVDIETEKGKLQTVS